MTRREKVLGVCVGGALAVSALAAIVRWAVLEPFETVKKDIRQEQQRTRTLTAQLTEMREAEQQWQALTRRTFADAADPQDAQRLFREDVHRLLERHGLRDPKISPGSFVRYKDDSIGVPLTINATGTLNEVVGFLRDFYRRDNLARIDKVRVSAEQNIVADVNNPRHSGGGRDRGGRGGPSPREVAVGPNGPDLKVSISAMTVVLPRLPNVGHPLVQGMPEELEHGRLAEADLAAYNAIFEKNLFMPYREKPTPVAAARPPDRQSEPVVTPPTPRVDPRAGVDQIYLRATVSLDGEPIAYVTDERRPTDKPQQVHPDHSIDDGTVVLIHPTGMVVRVQGADAVTDYFYPLGANFRERAVLNPDEHPEVWDAFQRQRLSSGADTGAGAAGGGRVSLGRDGC